jgi:hypothetical protein
MTVKIWYSLYEEVMRDKIQGVLLPFSSKSFVFVYNIWKCEDQNVQNYNYTCGGVQSHEIKCGRG